LLQGEDRGPIWPTGFVGSITHADFWCAAAVARESDVRAVGIDIESVAPVRPSVLERVCTIDERRWIEASEHPDQMAKVFFSAKESVYKCQRPITGAYLGFHAVEIEAEEGRFRAVFRRPAGEFAPGDALSGRYLVDRDWVATACVLEAG
ncbi:MAG: 4'-phosphopantetheinyl transferase superfamily protein, partial [Myxococcota bacterium]